MNENTEILEYIYKDVNMGAESITTLIKTLQSKDNKIKPVLEKVLKKYEEYIKKSEKQLKKLKVELKEFSTMAKMSSWMGIKMEMLKDNSDARIADMLIKGLTVGTIDMNKKIDNYEKIVDKDILKFAKEFKSFQEDSIEKLKVYL